MELLIKLIMALVVLGALYTSGVAIANANDGRIPIVVKQFVNN